MRSIFISFLAIISISFSCGAKDINEIFDHVYVISLDRTPERYKEVSENLDKVGLKHTRFSATDGYEVKVVDLMSQKEMNGKEFWAQCKSAPEGAKKSYEVHCDESPENNIVIDICSSPGEIGCYCSHRRVWKDVLDKKIDTALVLEDDALIPEKFQPVFVSKITDLMENVPSDWDLLFLHAYVDNKKMYPISINAEMSNRGFFKKYSYKLFKRFYGNEFYKSDIFGINRDPYLNTASTAAYAINKNFAIKMHPFSKKMTHPVDFALGVGVDANLINGYKAATHYFVPDEEEQKSVIKDMGR